MRKFVQTEDILDLNLIICMECEDEYTIRNIPARYIEQKFK